MGPVTTRSRAHLARCEAPAFATMTRALPGQFDLKLEIAGSASPEPEPGAPPTSAEIGTTVVIASTSPTSSDPWTSGFGSSCPPPASTRDIGIRPRSSRIARDFQPGKSLCHGLAWIKAEGMAQTIGPAVPVGIRVGARRAEVTSVGEASDPATGNGTHDDRKSPGRSIIVRSI